MANEGRVATLHPEVEFLTTPEGRVASLHPEIEYQPDGVARFAALHPEVEYQPDGVARVAALMIEVEFFEPSSSRRPPIQGEFLRSHWYIQGQHLRNWPGQKT